MSKAFYKTIEGKFNKKTTSLFSKVFCRIFGVSLHDESNNTTQIFSKKCTYLPTSPLGAKFPCRKPFTKQLGKKLTKNPTPLFLKAFCRVFQRFSAWRVQKHHTNIFILDSKNLINLKKSTYLPTSPVQVLEVEVLVAGASGARKRKTRVPASLKKGHCRAAFSARFLTGK